MQRLLILRVALDDLLHELHLHRRGRVVLGVSRLVPQGHQGDVLVDLVATSKEAGQATTQMTEAVYLDVLKKHKAIIDLLTG
ncbi:hypothetical protein OAK15_01975 [Verrucomicrobia bacterium]|nr:hypothetical protein [Verrucomicrobiota bacterium]